MTGFNLATRTKNLHITYQLLRRRRFRNHADRKKQVFSNISTICSRDCVGGFGGGPPPVFLLSFLNEENSFFAVQWRLFHLSLTSRIVRFSWPTALTSLVISSHASVFLLFVMLLVSFDCIISRFFRTLSVITVILFLFPLPLNLFYFNFSHFLFRHFCRFFQLFPALTGTFFRAKFSKNESNLFLFSQIQD